MNKPRHYLHILLAAILFSGFTACTPEPGTKAWCEKMDSKAKGDWSVNELGDYTKHCIFK